MRVICDVQGTLIGNASATGSACLQAIQALHEAGLEVVLVSSSPGAPLAGLTVQPKHEHLQGDLSGAIWIDDEDAILRAAVWLGAIAVPAAQLVEFAALAAGASRPAPRARSTQEPRP